MSEKNRNVMPKFDLLPHPLRRVGHALLEFTRFHQLSSHGDNTFEHPLDTPVAPVVDWPPNQMIDTETITAYDRVFSGGMQPKSDDGMGATRTPFS